MKAIVLARVMAVGAVAVLTPGACGQQAAPPARAAAPVHAGATLAQVIDPMMADQLKRLSVACAVVVVVKDGDVAFAKGYGFADVAAQRPATADGTLFHVGSISKLFTGIAVMQLVERGALDLDRDVNDYIDFRVPTPPGGVPVTLRRLLTHHAGFEEHVKELFSRGPAPAPLGPWLARSLPQRIFPAGDIPAYSNYGVALAGYIVERAAALPFADHVRDRILRPLGMERSTFEQPLPPALLPLMARGYHAADEPPLPFVETIAAAPAGALAATGADMGRFMLYLLAGGQPPGGADRRILRPATLAQMLAPAVVTPTGSMGLAFFHPRVDEKRLIGHDGGTLTFTSRLLLAPEQHLGIFASYDGGNLGPAWNDLPRAILRHFDPSPAPPPDAAAERAAARVFEAPGTPEDVPVAARVAGAYQSTRRADTTMVRFDSLLNQIVFHDNRDGTLRQTSPLPPYGKAGRLKRDPHGPVPALFRDDKGRPMAFTLSADGRDHVAARLDIGSPAQAWQRVPIYLDARMVLPVVAACVLFALVTLLAWPLRPLGRRVLGRLRAPGPTPQAPGAGQPPPGRRARLVARLALAVQTGVLAFAAALFIASRRELIMASPALDPVFVGLFGLAWLGVVGSIACVAIAGWFWRTGAGSRATRVHHTAVALVTVVLAWFLVTWHIAGTTLVY